MIPATEIDAIRSRVSLRELIGRDERWLPIRDFNGRYEVSNFGRVRSVDQIIPYCDGRLTLHPGRLIKAGFDPKGGYYSVTLWRQNKPVRQVKVHILVSEAFVPNPGGLLEVNHKDLDKSNNYYGNLEWISRSRNVQHANENGKGHVTLTVDEVRKIRFMAVFGVPQRRLAERFKVSPSQISSIIRLRSWKHIR